MHCSSKQPRTIIFINTHLFPLYSACCAAMELRLPHLACLFEMPRSKNVKTSQFYETRNIHSLRWALLPTLNRDQVCCLLAPGSFPKSRVFNSISAKLGGLSADAGKSRINSVPGNWWSARWAVHTLEGNFHLSFRSHWAEPGLRGSTVGLLPGQLDSCLGCTRHRTIQTDNSCSHQKILHNTPPGKTLWLGASPLAPWLRKNLRGSRKAQGRSSNKWLFSYFCPSLQSYHYPCINHSELRDDWRT